MDEAVLMTRTLSLLGYIDGLFQDHGRKQLSERAMTIRDFIKKEMRKKNPYDTKDASVCCAHQFVLVEVLGEEEMPASTLSEVSYHITEGHYSGEVTETRVTYTDRKLTDELLMSQASDPDFLTKGMPEEDEPEEDKPENQDT